MKNMLKHCCIVLALCAGSACAQEGAPKEGALDKYINRDAKDTATRLEVLQHSVYEGAQEVTALAFMQEYGDRIKMKRVFYPALDRTLVPGYIFTPVKRQAGKRYPAVVIVHGGFHEHLEWHFFPLIEYAITRGYAVIFPEYRGSRGYGAEHYRNDYGVTDAADVIAAADYMAKQDYVDGDRIGVIGHSRGGMVTLAAIEKAPKRFKAAVDIAGLADFVAYMAYKPEYRREEVAKESPTFKGKLPFENLPAYIDVSPINHVDAIEAPLLVIGTTGDKIVPWTLHSGRLIDALKARGKTHEVKLYDNAPGGHIFIYGDSDESRDAFERSFNFIGKYLKP
jgi:dipeptidyl aminopeptidase/acylaminoacyl peptidase